MNRYSQLRGQRPNDQLDCSCWLVIDSEGGMKMTRGEPTTGRGEVAVSVNVSVPMSLFRKPLLRATVTVPQQAGVDATTAIQAVVELISSSDFDVDVAEA